MQLKNLNETITKEVVTKLESTFNPVLERLSTEPRKRHSDDPINYLKTSLVIFGFMLLIGTIVYTVVSQALSFQDAKQKGFPNSEQNINMAAFYVNRSVWEADNGRIGSKVISKNIPAKRAIVMQSMSDACEPDFCRFILKQSQLESFNEGYDDILANFIVGTDGVVYEGRGFERQGEMSIDKFGTTFNKDSIEISILCDNTLGQIKEIQVKALQRFLKKCVEQGKLIKDFKLFLNDQIAGSEFDEKLYKILQNFKNFAEGKECLSLISLNFTLSKFLSVPSIIREGNASSAEFIYNLEETVRSSVSVKLEFKSVSKTYG